ncbi:MAG TPA: nitrilase-related carbon-nitrogen hydrolase [Vicinamibacterales bacterium]|nr:nitrilase-related carbon-nitrogen hydrolase [Vicinamibacterales bacterium]
MRIALVQQHATRHKAANIARGLASLEAAARGGAEVVAFAELAFEWFYPQRPAGADPLAQAEPLEGPLVSAFQEKARELGVVVVLNLYERDGAHAYDSSPVIDADGTLLGVTRMVHITDYPCFHEQGYYTPGDTGAPVYHTRAGRIGVAICYDRHFPEYMRALAIGGADVVVVPQAGAVDEWPEGLYDAEMRVSAFQNGYFVALCNRVGQEDRLEFAGESFVCDPGGQVVARAPRGSDHVLHADLDLTECDRSSARRLFLRHRRPELYAAWTAGQRGGCLAVESTEGQDTAFGCTSRGRPTRRLRQRNGGWTAVGSCSLPKTTRRCACW